MPYQIKTFDSSAGLLENILANIDEKPGKELTRRIIRLFSENRLPVKVKCHEYGTPWEWYRISLFAGQKAETVIISTKTGYGKSVAAGLQIQVRITNLSTFSRLSKFTENIRGQIIGGRDCCFCAVGCRGSDYIFKYQGNEYIKCKNIGSNFRLKHINDNDIESIMMIINGEVIQR